VGTVILAPVPEGSPSRRLSFVYFKERPVDFETTIPTRTIVVHLSPLQLQRYTLVRWRLGLMPN
jgi:hypothetical protein